SPCTTNRTRHCSEYKRADGCYDFSGFLDLREHALRVRSLAKHTWVFILLFAPRHCVAQTQPQDIPRFRDVTQAAGIHFKHAKANQGISINLEEFGPGVCVADFDGDGWPDIYFVNARDRYNRGIKLKNALYRNNRDGTFTDVTDSASTPGTGFGLGCVWGD